jgi:hypothetical protein
MRGSVAAWLLIALLVLGAWPPAGAWAQAKPKDTSPVVGEGAGLYTQAAGVSTVGALDRLWGELEGVPGDVTAEQVKDASWRRRILELRLQMDFNAFAYDKDQLKGFRDQVDRAYEASGVYQDLNVFEKELGAPPPPEVTAQRLSEMNDALAALRDNGSRSQMRRFLASPLRAPRTKRSGPGLWDLTGSRATNDFDAVGNAANFETGIVAYLQGVDLGVSDIFDPNQAAQFHLVRKHMRDVVILSAMYPPISDVTRDAVKPLDDLVDDYGDVMDAFSALQFAKAYGMDTDKVSAELSREFDVAQNSKNQFINAHALDTLAVQLNGVRDAHRR